MHNEFKNGNKVFVDGPGQNNGKYYHKKLAMIIMFDLKMVQKIGFYLNIYEILILERIKKNEI